MKSLLFLLLPAGLLLSCGNNDSEKTTTNSLQTPSKHSARFNNGIDSLLTKYDSLSAAFIEWDSASLNSRSADLYAQLQDLPLTNEDVLEIKKDTAAFQHLNKTWTAAKSHALAIGLEGNWETKRRKFDLLGKNLFQMLRVLQYDNGKLFLQKCPMAFNDTGTGVWVSRKKEINNPYLGKHHPTYKAGMLHCGETEEELDLTKTSEKK